MNLTISNTIHIQGASEDFKAVLRDRLTFPNPKWLENDKRGYWNDETPTHLRCYEQAGSDLLIPRGFVHHLLHMAQDIKCHLQDRRRTLPEVDLIFHGRLKPYQETAVETVLSHDFGTLSAPAGSGKTVMTLYVIAKRKQPVLVVVHSKELQSQWCDRIQSFLGIPKDEIGIIGAGRKIIGRRITVALVQSLFKVAGEVRDHIGFILVDECHRAPSRTFTQAVTAFDCKFMLGLSATPWRRDGLSRLIYWNLGDVVHEIKKPDLLKSRDILPVEIVIRHTEFRTAFNPSEEYAKMLSELTRDAARNELIASDVASETRKNRGTCLVLSDRKAHCEAIRDLLWQKYELETKLLTGDTPKKEREAIVADLNSGKIKILIATGQLIGEGFDAKQLSVLFLATPIRFNGRVIQYVGRVIRPGPGKKIAKVFDYVDRHVGPLNASAKARARVFFDEV